MSKATTKGSKANKATTKASKANKATTKAKAGKAGKNAAPPEKAKRNFGKPNGKPGEEFTHTAKIGSGKKAGAVPFNAAVASNGTFGRVSLFGGFNLSQVCRRLAAEGFTPGEVFAAFQKAGGGMELIRINTIRDKMSTRESTKEHAALSKDQLAAFRMLADAAEAK